MLSIDWRTTSLQDTMILWQPQAPQFSLKSFVDTYRYKKTEVVTKALEGLPNLIKSYRTPTCITCTTVKEAIAGKLHPAKHIICIFVAKRIQGYIHSHSWQQTGQTYWLMSWAESWKEVTDTFTTPLKLSKYTVTEDDAVGPFQRWHWVFNL